MTKKKDWRMSVFMRNGAVYISNGAAKYCGLEIELNLPLDLYRARELLDIIIESCRDENKSVHEIQKLNERIKRPVRFEKMISLFDEKTLVWRIVFADSNNLFPEDPACESIYKRQLSVDNDMNYEEYLNQYDIFKKVFDA